MAMHRTPKTIVRVSPASLQVARVSGRELVASETVELNGFGWADAWQNGLASLDEHLETSVRALGISKRSPTLVIYESPDATAMIVRLPRSATDPVRAAHLLLSETVRFPLHQGCAIVKPLPEAAGTDCDNRPWLAGADSEATLSTLATWVRRGGLELVSAVPTQSVLIASAARQTTSDLLNRIVLHVGTDSTVIVGSAGGSVLFSRTIDSGVGDMVASLERARTPTDAAEGSHPGGTLFDLGIPESRQQIDRFKAECGVNPLPLLQPLLQRFIVEIKQSIRFSYEDAQSQPQELVLSGQGAAIPGLAGLIGSQVDLPTDACPRSARFSPSEPAGPGSELDIASRLPIRQFTLLPQATREKRLVAAGRLAIACGLGIAAAGVFGERHLVEQTRAHLEQRIAASQPQIDQARFEQERELIATSGASTLARTVRRLTPQLEGRASLSMLLSSLMVNASDRVRLVEIRAGIDGGAPTATIEGILLGSDSGSDLRGYINAIAASPACRHVAVAWSRAARIDGERSLRFALDVELEQLPIALSLGWGPDLGTETDQ